MGQTRDETTGNLAERWCWEVARRDDARVARRLDRTQVVDGVYRLDEGAVLEDFLHFLPAIGVLGLLEEAHGAASHRQMVPCVQDVRRDGVKTRLGSERSHALPSLRCRDEALMQLVGFKAQPVRDGVGQRGATTRQAERAPGPICPATRAKNRGPWHVRDLEGVCQGTLRALAKAGVCGPKVTGLLEGTDLETTERSTGCGQVTRTVRIEATRGQMHAIAVTVYGWKVRLVSEAVTQIPLAVNVGQMQAHAPHWTRALVTQARAHLAGYARLHKVVFDQGCLAGTDRWWHDHQGLCWVVPANATRAVTAEARAHAAAGEDMTCGRRVHTVRHGQGRGARTARLEIEVVGMTGLTTEAQSGTPEPGRQHNRRTFQANPSNAVVVRKWEGQD
jgi:hypothetical protein